MAVQITLNASWDYFRFIFKYTEGEGEGLESFLAGKPHEQTQLKEEIFSNKAARDSRLTTVQAECIPLSQNLLSLVL